jgi:cytochrome c-type biogenesis protein CcmF
VTQTFTSETALHLSGLGMLYVTMGDQDKADHKRWVIRFYHHPLIALLFGGGGMIALGGLLALAGSARGRERAAA